MSHSPGDGAKPSEPPRPEAAPPAGSLDDPAAFRIFVQSLFGPLQKRLASELDLELQVAIARLTRLLNAMPRKAVEETREMFELAYSLLAADKPNLVLVQSLVADLVAINSRHGGSLSRLILRVCGTTPLNAVLSALFTIVAMSFVVMLVMVASVKLMRFAVSDAPDGLGLLGVLQGMAVPQLLLMTHAAFFGSIVSIVVRINDFLMTATMTPFMIYVAVVTRPVISVLIAMLAFTTLKSGLISFHGVDLDTPNGSYLAWAIGFLCGFSERLAQQVAIGASHSFGESTPAAAKPGVRSSKDES